MRETIKALSDSNMKGINEDVFCTKIFSMCVFSLYLKLAASETLNRYKMGKYWENTRALGSLGPRFLTNFDIFLSVFQVSEPPPS